MAKTTTEIKKATKAAEKKTGKVHLLILMDESGSMSGKEEAVVTGCNEFLHTFADNKDARAWLAWFDAHPGEERTRFKAKAKKIADVNKLGIQDYNPRGMTPLNDAILDALSALDKKVGKDETVFMAIITDGLENASEADTATVKKAIGKYEGKGWGFVYLGANQHAETSAAQIGLARKGQAFNFDATQGGVKNTMKTTSQLAHTRSASGQGVMGNEAYLVAAAALYDETGGKIDEDDDE